MTIETTGTWILIDENTPKMKSLLLWGDTTYHDDFPNWKMDTGYFCHERNSWVWEGRTVQKGDFIPTHWMELPKIPESKKYDF
jgi:hypothetical protein